MLSTGLPTENAITQSFYETENHDVAKMDQDIVQKPIVMFEIDRVRVTRPITETSSSWFTFLFRECDTINLQKTATTIDSILVPVVYIQQGILNNFQETQGFIELITTSVIPTATDGGIAQSSTYFYDTVTRESFQSQWECRIFNNDHFLETGTQTLYSHSDYPEAQSTLLYPVFEEQMYEIPREEINTLFLSSDRSHIQLIKSTKMIFTTEIKQVESKTLHQNQEIAHSQLLLDVYHSVIAKSSIPLRDVTQPVETVIELKTHDRWYKVRTLTFREAFVSQLHSSVPFTIIETDSFHELACDHLSRHIPTNTLRHIMFDTIRDHIAVPTQAHIVEHISFAETFTIDIQIITEFQESTSLLQMTTSTVFKALEKLLPPRTTSFHQAKYTLLTDVETEPAITTTCFYEVPIFSKRVYKTPEPLQTTMFDSQKITLHTHTKDSSVFSTELQEQCWFTLSNFTQGAQTETSMLKETINEYYMRAHPTTESTFLFENVRKEKRSLYSHLRHMDDTSILCETEQRCLRRQYSCPRCSATEISECTLLDVKKVLFTTELFESAQSSMAVIVQPSDSTPYFESTMKVWSKPKRWPDIVSSNLLETRTVMLNIDSRLISVMNTILVLALNMPLSTKAKIIPIGSTFVYETASELKLLQDYSTTMIKNLVYYETVDYFNQLPSETNIRLESVEFKETTTLLSTLESLHILQTNMQNTAKPIMHFRTSEGIVSTTFAETLTEDLQTVPTPTLMDRPLYETGGVRPTSTSTFDPAIETSTFLQSTKLNVNIQTMIAAHVTCFSPVADIGKVSSKTLCETITYNEVDLEKDSIGSNLGPPLAWGRTKLLDTTRFQLTHMSRPWVGLTTIFYQSNEDGMHQRSHGIKIHNTVIVESERPQVQSLPLLSTIITTDYNPLELLTLLKMPTVTSEAQLFFEITSCTAPKVTELRVDSTTFFENSILTKAEDMSHTVQVTIVKESSSLGLYSSDAYIPLVTSIVLEVATAKVNVRHPVNIYHEVLIDTFGLGVPKSCSEVEQINFFEVHTVDKVVCRDMSRESTFLLDTIKHNLGVTTELYGSPCVTSSHQDHFTSLRKELSELLTIITPLYETRVLSLVVNEQPGVEKDKDVTRFRSHVLSTTAKETLLSQITKEMERKIEYSILFRETRTARAITTPLAGITTSIIETYSESKISSLASSSTSVITSVFYEIGCSLLDTHTLTISVSTSMLKEVPIRAASKDHDIPSNLDTFFLESHFSIPSSIFEKTTIPYVETQVSNPLNFHSLLNVISSINWETVSVSLNVPWRAVSILNTILVGTSAFAASTNLGMIFMGSTVFYETTSAFTVLFDTTVPTYQSFYLETQVFRPVFDFDNLDVNVESKRFHETVLLTFSVVGLFPHILQTTVLSTSLKHIVPTSTKGTITTTSFAQTYTVDLRTVPKATIYERMFYETQKVSGTSSIRPSEAAETSPLFEASILSIERDIEVKVESTVFSEFETPKNQLSMHRCDTTELNEVRSRSVSKEHLRSLFLENNTYKETERIPCTWTPELLSVTSEPFYESISMSLLHYSPIFIMVTPFIETEMLTISISKKFSQKDPFTFYDTSSVIIDKQVSASFETMHTTFFQTQKRYQKSLTASESVVNQKDMILKCSTAFRETLSNQIPHLPEDTAFVHSTSVLDSILMQHTRDTPDRFTAETFFLLQTTTSGWVRDKSLVMNSLLFDTLLKLYVSDSFEEGKTFYHLETSTLGIPRKYSTFLNVTFISETHRIAPTTSIAVSFVPETTSILQTAANRVYSSSLGTGSWGLPEFVATISIPFYQTSNAYLLEQTPQIAVSTGLLDTTISHILKSKNSPRLQTVEFYDLRSLQLEKQAPGSITTMVTSFLDTQRRFLGTSTTCDPIESTYLYETSPTMKKKNIALDYSSRLYETLSIKITSCFQVSVVTDHTSVLECTWKQHVRNTEDTLMVETELVLETMISSYFDKEAVIINTLLLDSSMKLYSSVEVEQLNTVLLLEINTAAIPKELQTLLNENLMVETERLRPTATFSASPIPETISVLETVKSMVHSTYAPSATTTFGEPVSTSYREILHSVQPDSTFLWQTNNRVFVPKQGAKINTILMEVSSLRAASSRNTLPRGTFALYETNDVRLISKPLPIPMATSLFDTEKVFITRPSYLDYVVTTTLGQTEPSFWIEESQQPNLFTTTFIESEQVVPERLYVTTPLYLKNSNMGITSVMMETKSFCPFQTIASPIKEQTLLFDSILISVSSLSKEPSVLTTTLLETSSTDLVSEVTAGYLASMLSETVRLGCMMSLSGQENMLTGSFYETKTSHPHLAPTRVVSSLFLQFIEPEVSRPSLPMKTAECFFETMVIDLVHPHVSNVDVLRTDIFESIRALPTKSQTLPQYTSKFFEISIIDDFLMNSNRAINNTVIFETQRESKSIQNSFVPTISWYYETKSFLATKVTSPIQRLYTFVLESILSCPSPFTAAAGVKVDVTSVIEMHQEHIEPNVIILSPTILVETSASFPPNPSVFTSVEAISLMETASLELSCSVKDSQMISKTVLFDTSLIPQPSMIDQSYDMSTVFYETDLDSRYTVSKTLLSQHIFFESKTIAALSPASFTFETTFLYESKYILLYSHPQTTSFYESHTTNLESIELEENIVPETTIVAESVCTMVQDRSSYTSPVLNTALLETTDKRGLSTILTPVETNSVFETSRQPVSRKTMGKLLNTVLLQVEVLRLLTVAFGKLMVHSTTHAGTHISLASSSTHVIEHTTFAESTSMALPKDDSYLHFDTLIFDTIKAPFSSFFSIPTTTTWIHESTSHSLSSTRSMSRLNTILLQPVQTGLCFERVIHVGAITNDYRETSCQHLMSGAVSVPSVTSVVLLETITPLPTSGASQVPEIVRFYQSISRSLEIDRLEITGSVLYDTDRVYIHTLAESSPRSQRSTYNELRYIQLGPPTSKIVEQTILVETSKGKVIGKEDDRSDEFTTMVLETKELMMEMYTTSAPSFKEDATSTVPSENVFPVYSITYLEMTLISLFRDRQVLNTSVLLDSIYETHTASVPRVTTPIQASLFAETIYVNSPKFSFTTSVTTSLLYDTSGQFLSPAPCSTVATISTQFFETHSTSLVMNSRRVPENTVILDTLASRITLPFSDFLTPVVTTSMLDGGLELLEKRELPTIETSLLYGNVFLDLDSGYSTRVTESVGYLKTYSIYVESKTFLGTLLEETLLRETHQDRVTPTSYGLIMSTNLFYETLETSVPVKTDITDMNTILYNVFMSTPHTDTKAKGPVSFLLYETKMITVNNTVTFPKFEPTLCLDTYRSRVMKESSDYITMSTETFYETEVVEDMVPVTVTSLNTILLSVFVSTPTLSSSASGPLTEVVLETTERNAYPNEYILAESTNFLDTKRSQITSKTSSVIAMTETLYETKIWEKNNESTVTALGTVFYDVVRTIQASSYSSLGRITQRFLETSTIFLDTIRSQTTSKISSVIAMTETLYETKIWEKNNESTVTALDTVFYDVVRTIQASSYSFLGRITQRFLETSSTHVDAQFPSMLEPTVYFDTSREQVGKLLSSHFPMATTLTLYETKVIEEVSYLTPTPFNTILFESLLSTPTINGKSTSAITFSFLETYSAHTVYQISPTREPTLFLETCKSQSTKGTYFSTASTEAFYETEEISEFLLSTYAPINTVLFDLFQSIPTVSSERSSVFTISFLETSSTHLNTEVEDLVEPTSFFETSRLVSSKHRDLFIASTETFYETKTIKESVSVWNSLRTVNTIFYELLPTTPTVYRNISSITFSFFEVDLRTMDATVGSIVTRETVYETSRLQATKTLDMAIASTDTYYETKRLDASLEPDIVTLNTVMYSVLLSTPTDSVGFLPPATVTFLETISTHLDQETRVIAEPVLILETTLLEYTKIVDILKVSTDMFYETELLKETLQGTASTDVAVEKTFVRDTSRSQVSRSWKSGIVLIETFYETFMLENTVDTAVSSFDTVFNQVFSSTATLISDVYYPVTSLYLETALTHVYHGLACVGQPTQLLETDRMEITKFRPAVESWTSIVYETKEIILVPENTIGILSTTLYSTSRSTPLPVVDRISTIIISLLETATLQAQLHAALLQERTLLYDSSRLHFGYSVNSIPASTDSFLETKSNMPQSEAYFSVLNSILFDGISSIPPTSLPELVPTTSLLLETRTSYVDPVSFTALETTLVYDLKDIQVSKSAHSNQPCTGTFFETKVLEGFMTETIPVIWSTLMNDLISSTAIQTVHVSQTDSTILLETISIDAKTGVATDSPFVASTTMAETFPTTRTSLQRPAPSVYSDTLFETFQSGKDASSNRVPINVEGFYETLATENDISQHVNLDTFLHETAKLVPTSTSVDIFTVQTLVLYETHEAYLPIHPKTIMCTTRVLETDTVQPTRSVQTLPAGETSKLFEVSSLPMARIGQRELLSTTFNEGFSTSIYANHQSAQSDITMLWETDFQLVTSSLDTVEVQNVHFFETMESGGNIVIGFDTLNTAILETQKSMLVETSPSIPIATTFVLDLSVAMPTSHVGDLFADTVSFFETFFAQQSDHTSNNVHTTSYAELAQSYVSLNTVDVAVSVELEKLLETSVREKPKHKVFHAETTVYSETESRHGSVLATAIVDSVTFLEWRDAPLYSLHPESTVSTTALYDTQPSSLIKCLLVTSQRTVIFETIKIGDRSLTSSIPKDTTLIGVIVSVNREALLEPYVDSTIVTETVSSSCHDNDIIVPTQTTHVYQTYFRQADSAITPVSTTTCFVQLSYTWHSSPTSLPISSSVLMETSTIGVGSISNAEHANGVTSNFFHATIMYFESFTSSLPSFIFPCFSDVESFTVNEPVTSSVKPTSSRQTNVIFETTTKNVYTLTLQPFPDTIVFRETENLYKSSRKSSCPLALETVLRNTDRVELLSFNKPAATTVNYYEIGMSNKRSLPPLSITRLLHIVDKRLVSCTTQTEHVQRVSTTFKQTHTSPIDVPKETVVESTVFHQEDFASVDSRKLTSIDYSTIIDPLDILQGKLDTAKF
jgi:hypothetical protein